MLDERARRLTVSMWITVNQFTFAIGDRLCSNQLTLTIFLLSTIIVKDKRKPSKYAVRIKTNRGSKNELRVNSNSSNRINSFVLIEIYTLQEHVKIISQKKLKMSCAVIPDTQGLLTKQQLKKQKRKEKKLLQKEQEELNVERELPVEEDPKQPVPTPSADQQINPCDAGTKDEGEEKKAPKKPKTKKPKKKKQTSPEPTIPISVLFPEGKFPEGEIQQHPLDL
jgi:hypothetical protein